MELAHTFNHAGCIFFEQKRYGEAYDEFCGALQVLVISKGESNLDPHSKNLMLMDPCIHRAYDRIGMAGLFQSSNNQRQKKAEDSQSDVPSSPQLQSHPQHEQDDHYSHGREEEILSKPLLIPLAPWMSASTDDDPGLVDMETKKQHFAIAMAVVWMNKGLVLREGRLGNVGRSSSCYAMALQWLSSLDELKKNSTIVQGLLTLIYLKTNALEFL